MRLSRILCVNLSSFSSIDCTVFKVFRAKYVDAIDAPFDMSAFNTLPHVGRLGFRATTTEIVTSPRDLVLNDNKEYNNVKARRHTILDDLRK